MGFMRFFVYIVYFTCYSIFKINSKGEYKMTEFKKNMYQNMLMDIGHQVSRLNSLGADNREEALEQNLLRANLLQSIRRIKEIIK